MSYSSTILRGTGALSGYLCGLAGLLLLACAGSDPEPVAPTLTPTAGPSASIVFNYDDSIAVEERDLVEQTIAESRNFYVEALGHDLKLDVTIEVTAEDGDFYLGLSYGRTAWLFTGSASWPQGQSLLDRMAKQQVIAHELFHNFQSDLQYTDDALPSYSPRWIVEGSAEYASRKFIQDQYGGDWMEYALGYRVQAAQPLPRLDSNAMRTSELYAKSFVAVDELMGTRPLSVLGDYFEMTGRMDWQDAFVAVFGVDPDEFLERFEASQP